MPAILYKTSPSIYEISKGIDIASEPGQFRIFVLLVIGRVLFRHSQKPKLFAGDFYNLRLSLIQISQFVWQTCVFAIDRNVFYYKMNYSCPSAWMNDSYKSLHTLRDLDPATISVQHLINGSSIPDYFYIDPLKSDDSPLPFVVESTYSLYYCESFFRWSASLDIRHTIIRDVGDIFLPVIDAQENVLRMSNRQDSPDHHFLPGIEAQYDVAQYIPTNIDTELVLSKTHNVFYNS